MKKLILSLMLVLGVYQTSMPIFAAARAAVASRMQAISGMQAAVTGSKIASRVRSVAPLAIQVGLTCALERVFAQRIEDTMKPVHSLIEHPGFAAHNGLIDRHWLLRLKDSTYGWLGEIQSAMTVLSMVSGGAMAAYSMVKKDAVQPGQNQQPAAQEQQLAQSQITPEMIAAQHRENQRILAQNQYNPLVIRA